MRKKNLISLYAKLPVSFYVINIWAFIYGVCCYYCAAFHFVLSTSEIFLLPLLNTLI